MSRFPITVSAPGSLMLTGEHAVLHGRRAIVLAVDRRIRVTLQLRADRAVVIRSAVASARLSLDALEPHPALRFVCECIRRLSGGLPGGFELDIVSEFPPNLGLGSSAAVTVATLAALDAFAEEADAGGGHPECRMLRRDPHERGVAMQGLATEVIREVQGCGSGADVAASVFGGAVLYRQDPREIGALPVQPPLTVLYSGGKRPTPEVIAIVEERRRASADGFRGLFDAMDAVTARAWEAVGGQDWRALGLALNDGQALMETLGVSNERLQTMIAWLRARRGVFGAKISGSGLGDCVLGVGRAEAAEWPFEFVPVGVSVRGVAREEGEMRC